MFFLLLVDVVSRSLAVFFNTFAHCWFGFTSFTGWCVDRAFGKCNRSEMLRV